MIKKLSNILLVISGGLAIVLFSCKAQIQKADSSPSGALVGLALQIYKNTAPGLDGYIDAINYTHSIGVNLFGMSPTWTELETSPNNFSLHDAILNPLTLLNPDSTKIKTFVLVLKMIDTNQKDFPADIASKSFDDPLVINRFSTLIDAISNLPPIHRISYILIGNEVDAYLTSHPSELNGFMSFYQQAVQHIHVKMPWIKVSTIITFNSLTTNPGVFNTLNTAGDFVCYTYYPTDESKPNWQMRPPSDVFNDIKFMSEKAGDKPFAFTEIGYPSSEENNSSEQLQQQFVQNMFDALRSYKHNLAFTYYHGLYDYPPAFCEQYSQQQGISSTGLCMFMNNLGLKNYNTGKAKTAWDVFVQQMKTW